MEKDLGFLALLIFERVDHLMHIAGPLSWKRQRKSITATMSTSRPEVTLERDSPMSRCTMGRTVSKALVIHWAGERVVCPLKGK